jgi:hypothetical protein
MASLALPESSRRGLWLRWFGWVTLGETVGFCVPATVAALTIGAPAAVALPCLLLAGAAEGAILGSAQAHVLRRALPALPAGRWVTVTGAAAVVAWLLGLVPGTVGSSLSGWPAPVLAALTVAGGAVLLLSIGTAQWTVLRGQVPRARRWILVTAAGWLAGLAVFMVIATPLWREGQPAALTAAIGAIAGLAMAATVAAVTGLGLVRLLTAVGAIRRAHIERGGRTLDLELPASEEVQS